jgi:hypothetical protein
VLLGGGGDAGVLDGVHGVSSCFCFVVGQMVPGGISKYYPRDWVSS